MDMVYVVPAAGGRVRQPERSYRVMPAEGDFVPRTSHWERLIITGDVIVSDPPEAAPEVVEAAAEALAAKPSTRPRNPSKDEA